jgi:hypothetical protein
MQFSFFMTMHSDLGQRSLEDVCGIMGRQLNALGHRAVVDPRNERVETAAFVHSNDGINIIVEGFTPGWINVLKVGKDWGARFIILATEEPTEKGFNWGTQKEMVIRQKIFPEAAQYADGILHLVPGEHVTKWYSQFAPSAPAELGFAPALFRPKNVEPTYEFGFYGSVTPRRLKILKKLNRMSNSPRGVKIMADFKTQEERDAEMRKAKVIVQLRKFEAMGLVSSSRCNTSLMIGRPVIAEPHDLVKPWNEVIDFASSMENFYARCMLAKGMWKSIWASQVDKFKTKMSPEFCIGEPLARIGILDGEGKAIAA